MHLFEGNPARDENRNRIKNMKTTTLTIDSQSSFPIALTGQAITAEGTPSRNGSDAFVALIDRRPVEGDTIRFQEQHSTRSIAGTITEVRGVVTGMIDFDVSID